MNTRYKLDSMSADVPSLIQDIAKAKKKEDKQKLLKEKTGKCFIGILSATHNPFITYLPEGTEEIEFSEPCEHTEVFSYNWSHATHLIGKIASRQIKGVDFKKHVRLASANLNAAQQEVLYGILTKDLGCGLDADIINGVFPGLIPVFGVQVGVKANVNDIEYPAYVEYLYEGVRTIVVNESKAISLYNAEGVPLDIKNDKIVEELKKFKKGVVLDCVLEKGKGQKLVVTDMLTMGEYLKNRYVNSQAKRTQRLKECFEVFEGTDVVMVKCMTVNDISGFKRRFKRAVEAGAKGLVVKKLEPVYMIGPSGNWQEVTEVGEVE